MESRADVEIAEINWGLKFSKIFFDAFEIDVERVAQWGFITFLLKFEQDARISIKTLTKNRKFTEFLIATGRNTPSYVLHKVLIPNFGNERGSFVDVSDKDKGDWTITLNDNFHNAARKYVTGFVDLMGGEELQWDVQSASQKQVLQWFKAILKFQNDTYYPSWRSCIGKLAELGENNEVTSEEIAEELERHAPNWSLLLTIWKKHLGDVQISTTKNGLWRAVFESMRGADIGEVKNCIDFLTGKGGPNILKVEKLNGKIAYSLLPKYEDALRTYIVEFIAARPKLMADLKLIVNQPELKTGPSVPAV